MPKTSPPWENRRQTLIKSQAATDLNFGCRPEDRAGKDIFLYGVINLDKPAGPTSHEVAAWTKRSLKLARIGHGGILDPNVTGVLPVTLEDSTKVVQALLYSGKEYICVMKVHGDVEEDKIMMVLEEFEDEIYQRPPLRASVKRQLRTRRIYHIDSVEVEGRNVLFRVGCEGGTYIRKLCYDVGEILGVGAHMQELRRTRAGPFTETSSTFVTLHQVANWFAEWQETKEDALLKRFIQPMENALALLPKIVVRDSAVDALCHGANLTAPGVLSVDTGIKKDSVTAILTLKGEAIALAQALLSTEEIIKLDHGAVASVKRVVMPRGTYPKVWGSDRKT